MITEHHLTVLPELPSGAVNLAAALEYAVHNWPVFPGRGKWPAIRNPHAEGSAERQQCKGECGLPGHGVYDATTDQAIIARWWCGRYAGCNILGRVPEPMFVLDTDPYHGGLDSLAALKRHDEPLPETLTDYSGRGDGGAHYFFRRPPGKLSAKRLGPGIDIKTSTGYVVLPPSIHPATGKPYTRVERPVAAPPAWLVALLRPEPPKIQTPKPLRLSPFRGTSIADEFSAHTSWSDILGPHGWSCYDADPDADGARWLHPTHTSACSATVRHGCLFVWTPNTKFDVSEPGDPHGVTRFRAYAVLNHGGDMSAAARALKGVA